MRQSAQPLEANRSAAGAPAFAEHKGTATRVSEGARRPYKPGKRRSPILRCTAAGGFANTARSCRLRQDRGGQPERAAGTKIRASRWRSPPASPNPTAQIMLPEGRPGRSSGSMEYDSSLKAGAAPGVRDKIKTRAKIMMRTSETHRCGSTRSKPAPGARRDRHHFRTGQARSPRAGVPWARDLTKDLDAIEAWNAKGDVTLIEAHEFLLLAIPNIADEVQRRGMEWLHLPIRDVGTPEQGVRDIGPRKVSACANASTPVKISSSIATAASAGPAWSRRACWWSPRSSPRRRWSACGRRGLVRSRRRGKRNGSGTVRRDFEWPRHERFQP